VVSATVNSTSPVMGVLACRPWLARRAEFGARADGVKCVAHLGA
jgi:hypothetical protein